MSSIKQDPSLRLRVFAGPNGSGKSTIIQAVRDYKIKSIPVDFGIYVNADDIAVCLRNKTFTFSVYSIKVSDGEFCSIVEESGLINDKFTHQEFKDCYQFNNNSIVLLNEKADERLAQIIAYFLREKLLLEKKKFSFETVFSHTSKLDIMRKARDAGYKVYLYFVSTENPEINKYRVDLRKKKGGHDVPPLLIESRYYRSLEFLYEAAQLSYQTFFFDNSGEQFKMFAHFKMINGAKKWDKIVEKDVPEWFKQYYSGKIKK